MPFLLCVCVCACSHICRYASVPIKQVKLIYMNMYTHLRSEPSFSFILVQLQIQ